MHLGESRVFLEETACLYREAIVQEKEKREMTCVLGLQGRSERT